MLFDIMREIQFYEGFLKPRAPKRRLMSHYCCPNCSFFKKGNLDKNGSIIKMTLPNQSRCSFNLRRAKAGDSVFRGRRESREKLASKKIILLLLAVYLIMSVSPISANADRGGRAARSCCLGFSFGALFGWILAPRVVEPRYEPPPPPRTCYRIIPGHCEDRWDPYEGRYYRFCYPERREPFPCP